MICAAPITTFLAWIAEHWDWAMAVSIALGLPALFLAWQHVGDLHRVLHSMSTRYIGQFPEFLPELVKLMEDANRSSHIVVMCDLPSYGHFSAADESATFRAIIDERGAQGATVDAMFLSAARRNGVLAVEFSGVGERWEEWKKDRKFRAKLQQFVERHRLPKTVDELSYAEFQTHLSRVDKNALRRFTEHGDVFELDAPMPIHFWIVGDRNAVFSIPSYTDGSSEHGFRTSDPQLIQALKETFRRLSLDAPHVLESSLE